MVKLNKIYTKTGDAGRTKLATGEDVAKFNARVEAYGAVDEANSFVGLAVEALATGDLKGSLIRVMNDLFDLGADLATPERGAPLKFEALRIVDAQVARLEADIDRFNADLAPLESFVLPAGSDAAARLHVARAVTRRAERRVAALMSIEGEHVSGAALRYLNRLSDFLFVAARWVNTQADGDVLWIPGANR